MKGPVASIYGPHICGDAIDFKNDGTTMLTGSYRQEHVLELWDQRTWSKYRDIDWDGPKVSENYQEQSQQLEDQMQDAQENPGEPKKDEEVNLAEQEGQRADQNTSMDQDVASSKSFTRQSPAPFVYAAQFNNK